eukprot:1752636-Ditylum_brightwellii.AAC.1
MSPLWDGCLGNDAIECLDEHQDSFDIIGVKFPDAVRSGETVGVSRIKTYVERRVEILSVGVIREGRV